jgi:hypothetical protein
MLFPAQSKSHNHCVEVLEKGEGERFAATFVLDGEFTGGRGPGRGSEVRRRRPDLAGGKGGGEIGGLGSLGKSAPTISPAFTMDTLTIDDGTASICALDHSSACVGHAMLSLR